MKSLKVIGIDVSKEELDISIYNGEEHVLDSIENTCKSIQNYLDQWEDKKENLHFVIEATGIYHLKLADLLYDNDFKVSVVNPLKIKKFGEMKMLRANTDITASRKIAEYGYSQKPKLYEKTTKNRRKLVKIMKTIDGLKKTKNDNRNRLESIKNDSIEYEDIEQQLENTIDQIEDSIKELEAKARKLVEENHSKKQEQMLNIKGVGEVVSTAVIGYFGGFEDFDNAKQPVAYVGINPNPRESGTSVKGEGNISKKGVKYLRSKLYMAALSASKYNPSCKALKERMEKRGKHHEKIRIAVASKLLRQIFAVVKYDREWDPNYEKKFKS